MLRRIFGPKRDEITGESRKLYNEELNNLYSSPNTVRVFKSRRMRWAGHIALMGDRPVVVERPDAKRSFGRSGRSWEDNIKIYLQ